MDKQIVRDFLVMQMNEAERAETEQESALLFLLMADYLLGAVQNQPELFEKMDTAQLRRAFLRCGSAGERIRTFYEKYHMPLQETSERILERINQNVTQIEQQYQKSVQLEAEIVREQETESALQAANQDILSKEKELEERKESCLKLQQTIAKCQQILEEITLEKLDEMQREKDQLMQEKTQREEKKETLNQEAEETRRCLEEITAQEEQLRAQKASDEEREKQVQIHTEELRAKIQETQMRTTVLEAEASELSAQVLEAQEAYEELRAYLKENERMEEQILEDGYFDRQSFLRELESVRKQGSALTEQYSRLLKNVLEDAQTLYDKIREWQRKK